MLTSVSASFLTFGFLAARAASGGKRSFIMPKKKFWASVGSQVMGMRRCNFKKASQAVGRGLVKLRGQIHQVVVQYPPQDLRPFVGLKLKAEKNRLLQKLQQFLRVRQKLGLRFKAAQDLHQAAVQGDLPQGLIKTGKTETSRGLQPTTCPI